VDAAPFSFVIRVASRFYACAHGCPVALERIDRFGREVIGRRAQ
jgi:hypothetical protein